MLENEIQKDIVNNYTSAERNAAALKQASQNQIQSIVGSEAKSSTTGEEQNVMTDKQKLLEQNK